jgi:hypothetical protein
MRKPDQLSKAVATQVALATTALPAQGGVHRHTSCAMIHVPDSCDFTDVSTHRFTALMVQASTHSGTPAASCLLWPLKSVPEVSQHTVVTFGLQGTQPRAVTTHHARRVHTRTHVCAHGSSHSPATALTCWLWRTPPRSMHKGA